ncbi:MAG TPA: DNA methyltransferase [Candidatus Nanoarchaeia archaeon]|nr:DNA methyltransferase [Candidatus Nanoarchaeia archaeon]
MANLFFLISGEFESLSFAELKAIFEAEKYPYTVIEKLDQTVRIQADQASVNKVVFRSGYTRICCQEIFTCAATEQAVIEAANATDFTSLADGETFEVRIRRIKEYTTKEATMNYERLLGKLIMERAPKAKVNLKTPQKTFFGILTNGKLIFGLKLAEIIPKPFVERRARKKPFFHPSAMNAKLARCMVNLAHAPEGGLVLDPFCGTGTALIEAALIGCDIVGIDVRRRMARGALRNVRHFGLSPQAILLADARQVPLTHVDCVVTDPPYGRSTTTMKSTTKSIIEGVLASVHPLLSGGQRICIAAPKTLGIRQIGEKLGYTHVESNFAFVHRTLTREVAVFEKKAKP